MAVITGCYNVCLQFCQIELVFSKGQFGYKGLYFSIYSSNSNHANSDQFGVITVWLWMVIDMQKKVKNTNQLHKENIPVENSS